jgi:hypothetical protein
MLGVASFAVIGGGSLSWRGEATVVLIGADVAADGAVTDGVVTAGAVTTAIGPAGTTFTATEGAATLGHRCP